MRDTKIALIVCLFLLIPLFLGGVDFPPVSWRDEGSYIGTPVFIDCSGDGVECTHSGAVTTISVSAGAANLTDYFNKSQTLALENLTNYYNKTSTLALATLTNFYNKTDIDGAGYLTSETDPQVGNVTNLKWCVANGTAINCDETAPAGTGNANYDFGANNFNGTGNFTTTGNSTAGFFLGNGSLLEGIPNNATVDAKGTSNVTISDVVALSNLTNYKRALHFTITNGTSAMTTGWYCCVEATNSFTASAWEVYSKDGTVGNITAIVKKSDFGAGVNNYTEGNFTACSGTENITLSSTSFNEDTSLGSFNTTIAVGERYGFNVTAVDLIKGVDIFIKE